MSKELSTKLTFDSKGLITQIENHENFQVKVVQTVDTLLERLPKDLTTIEVVQGDQVEKQIQTVIDKIKDTANAQQQKRMLFTRKFDEIKKGFTSAEKVIRESLAKLDEFVINWNEEKLKRQREEQKQIAEQQEKVQRLIEAKTRIAEHYLTLILRYSTEEINKLETSFYQKNETELKEWADKFKNWDASGLKNRWLKMFKQNSYPDIRYEEEKKIELDYVNENLEDFVDEKINQFKEKLHELITFTPSRIEQIKTQDEKDKAEEAKKLAAKQAAEKAEAEAKQKEELQAGEKEQKIAAAVDSIDAVPQTELSKGASIKLKYYPKDHAELLKIINWYLQNEYVNEDFDKLNKRLSFMRTAADSALNKEGLVIDGVPYKEEIKKRRTK